MNIAKSLSGARAFDRDTIEMVGAAALVFAVLVGKMALPLPLGILAEMRFFPMLLAFACLSPAILSIQMSPRQWSFVAVFSSLLVYLFARGFSGADAVAKQVDLVYLALQSCLVVVIASKSQTRKALAWAAVGIASLYVCMATVMLFLDPPNNFGLGWGRPGSAISFNRITFAGFAAALCLAANSGTKFYFLALATLFLFASFASLQKSAIAGGAIAVAVAVFSLVWMGKFRDTTRLVAVSIIAVAFMAVSPFSDKLMGRISEAAQTTRDEVRKSAPSAQQVAPTVEARIKEVASTATVTEVAQPLTRPSWFDTKVSYCLYDSTGGDLVCRGGAFVDRSERLVLWSEALRMLGSSPVFGSGLGSYSAALVGAENLSTFVYAYPHNVVMEIAAETGVIGLILYGLALTLLVCLAMASPADRSTKGYIWAFIIFMFIATMLGGDFYDTRAFWLSGMLLAFWARSTQTA